MTYGISSSLRANDNFSLDTSSPGDTTILDTTLSFGLLKETQVDRLEFDLDGIVRLGEVPGRTETIEFDDPNAAFAYTRDGANSNFSTDARINQVDLNFDDPLRIQDQLNSQSLIIDDGTRTTSRANVRFETGINDPLGYGFALNYFDERYTDTTDPGLFDNNTFRSDIFATFQFSPVTSGRLSYVYTDYDGDEAIQEERETNEVVFDLAYELDAATVLDTFLGYREINETDNTGALQDDQAGLVYGAVLTRDMPNGTASIGFDSDIATTGRRTNADISRSLIMPRGTLDASLGATKGPSGDIDPIYALDYTYLLPRSAFTASLSRVFRNDSQGNDIRVTRGSLSYLIDINAISSVDFTAGYAAVDDAGGNTVTNTDNTTLRATYTRALNADWNISAGYEYRNRFEQGVGTAQSNEIFLTLDRIFVVQR
ncbi:hypothetical protein [Ruegeria sp.]|uniref:hypothetical protein n=1 Tax=Ruegeria sp. TaxID=1879320 RepID=UPI002322204A|nr:hypothetical protein [Ruegeria sp.]MDA7965967.1 hypothetical protein [Ruegeria sp.]